GEVNQNWAELGYDERSELPAQVFQAHALFQAQSEKETFFQGGARRDDGSDTGLRSDEIFQRIRSREADCLVVRDARAKHRMRIDAEPEIGLASPVLQIMPRLETGVREVRYFVLVDFRGMQSLAGDSIQVGDKVFVRHKVR